MEIVLFDLNGTLCFRDKEERHKITLRPYIEYLYFLKKYYIVGVYTSMMRRNAMNIISMIEHYCDCNIFDRRYIFCREYTTPFSPEEIIKFNIAPYNTKKSLASVIGDISKVTIIDDEIFKIVEKERAIIIPTFTNVAKDHELYNIVSILLDPFC